MHLENAWHVPRNRGNLSPNSRPLSLQPAISPSHILPFSVVIRQLLSAHLGTAPSYCRAGLRPKRSTLVVKRDVERPEPKCGCSRRISERGCVCCRGEARVQQCGSSLTPRISPDRPCVQRRTSMGRPEDERPVKGSSCHWPLGATPVSPGRVVRTGAHDVSRQRTHRPVRPPRCRVQGGTSVVTAVLLLPFFPSSRGGLFPERDRNIRRR